jgi:lipopolysaccharide export system protein LptC
VIRLLLSLSVLACAVARAQAPGPPGPKSAPAPAQNWVLPIFTDKEGYRSMTLRGSEVRPGTGGKSIAVTNLNITIFSGDEKAQVDSILLSPSAIFQPKENLASGDSFVRFIRDDIEVTGTGWTYDHKTKNISLQQNVRVTFKAELKDILK